MTDITFKSIADLRRELTSQDTSSIQLIKIFVEEMKNENYENSDLVTRFFY